LLPGNRLGSGIAQDYDNVESRWSPVSSAVIGSAIAVHRTLGPGLLESTYSVCLAEEFAKRGIGFEREVPIPVVYGGVQLECGYRIDFLVERSLVVEIKSVRRLLPIHEAQVLTYLKLLEIDEGLLVNFNVQVLRHGLRMLVRNPKSSFPPSSLL
jgi:GxxExxY protein